MRHIAFTGSKGGMTLAQRRRVQMLLIGERAVCYHRGRNKADKDFVEIAEALEDMGKYVVRVHETKVAIDLSEIVIAAPSGFRERGFWAAVKRLFTRKENVWRDVDYARGEDLQLAIVYPDGSCIYDNWDDYDEKNEQDNGPLVGPRYH